MTSLNEELDLSKLSLKDAKDSEESYDFQNGPLREDFYSIQCPFTWTEVITHDKMKDTLSRPDIVNVGEPREWKIFCINIYFAAFNARLGSMEEAFRYIKLCRELILSNVNNDFYKDIWNGMDHALKATEAHILFLKGDTEEADNVMATIIPMKDLSGPCHGALLAIQSIGTHVLHLESMEQNLALLEEVIKLDPDENGSRRGIWYYLAGELKGQIRRIKYRMEIPSKEELQFLERAIEVNPFPVYLATLAESYRESAKWLRFNRNINSDERLIHKMNTESRRLIIAAINMDDNNPGTLRRCGNGLMRLPQSYQDIPLARKCLQKAILLDPYNSPAYQAIGKLEEIQYNFLDAAKYYKLSAENGNLIGGLFMIRMRFRMDPQYNPIKDLDEFLEKAVNARDTVKAAFHVAKGEFYLFKKNNLMLAANEWKKAIELAPESDSVKVHFRVFPGGRNRSNKTGGPPLNVYECLKREIERSPPVSVEDKAFLDEILLLCEKNA